MEQRQSIDSWEEDIKSMKRETGDRTVQKKGMAERGEGDGEGEGGVRQGQLQRKDGESDLLVAAQISSSEHEHRTHENYIFF